MLFMVINTHHAESCAFRSPEDAKAIMEPFDRFTNGLAAANGITIKGSWINRPSHEGFLLLDASSPHLIDDVLVEAGVIGRTHTRVLSVISTDDVEVRHDQGEPATAGARG
jgi:hypothetical protein